MPRKKARNPAPPEESANVVMPREFADTLLKYLMTRPYAEVEMGVAMLRQVLQPIAKPAPAPAPEPEE